MGEVRGSSRAVQGNRRRRRLLLRILVPEVAHAGEDHGEAGFIGGGDDFIVADGAAGLDDGGGTRFSSSKQAICEGEERV